MELVTRNYWWPEVIKNVGRYVEGYNMCQRTKNKTEVLAEKSKLNKVPERLWIYLTVDFITKLLVVAKKDVILVVCNRLSKMMYFVVTIKGMLAERLVRLFRDNVWKLYKLPESIVSDKCYSMEKYETDSRIRIKDRYRQWLDIEQIYSYSLQWT